MNQNTGYLAVVIGLLCIGMLVTVHAADSKSIESIGPVKVDRMDLPRTDPRTVPGFRQVDDGVFVKEIPAENMERLKERAGESQVEQECDCLSGPELLELTNGMGVRK